VTTRILQSWSGGKDSCLTLAELIRDGVYRVEVLLSTITEGYDRVSMHGVRRVLLERQAAALGFPLHLVPIPPNATNEAYQSRMEEAFDGYRRQGLSTVAFGDLFLEDIRRYREEWLAREGMRAIFPIWKRETDRLAREFVDSGYRAVVVCVDTRVLDPSFAGRRFDRGLLAALPPTVDPCGENGEFHTFVFDGPIFHREVAWTPGETVQRDCWAFFDLVPGE